MWKSPVPLLLVLLVLSSFGQSLAATSDTKENSWTTKAHMITPRANPGVAVVNGEIYVIGGNNVNGRYNLDAGFYLGIHGGLLSVNEKYDPITDRWTTETSMPTARDSFAMAVYQDKIFCIGGRTTIPFGSTTVNEVYIASNDTWQTKAPLPRSEKAVRAGVVGDIIYVIGQSGATYAYNPINDTWTTKTQAPSVNPHYIWFVSATFEGKIYAIGLSRLNQVYDPETDKWSILNSNMPYNSTGLMGYGDFETAAGVTSGVLAPKSVYVFSESLTIVYDPKTDNWTSGARMPGERGGYGITVLNDTFYAIGGGNLPYDFFDDYYPVPTNQRYLPVGYGTPDPAYLLETTAPAIFFSKPPNAAVNNSSLPLTFTINKPVEWIRYSLDGKDNATVNGNFTLTDLANGAHNLTVYAQDTFGNVGAETINFKVALPSPILIAAVIFGVLVAALATGLFAYRKIRRIAKPFEP
jgi:N-acetylneuraminic acid mutarotase